MRVGFAGTPEFAARALAAILGAGHAVPVVLTQPDRPRGRGLKLEPSPVKALARVEGLRVLQPASLKDEGARAAVTAIAVDVLVVAAYGLILPAAILTWPVHGGINIHASLLPRWRGAAPIQRALLAGDRETGITLMQMDTGLDTGPILDTVPLAIGPRETAGSLHDRLAAAGAEAIVGVLARLERDGVLPATPQPAEGACYASKIGRDEAVLHWEADATVLDRQVRAFAPAPGATTTLAGEQVKIWQATAEAASAVGVPPGTLLAADAQGIVVACGQGRLRVTELQQAGGRRMNAAASVAGRRIAAGMRFGLPQAREAGSV
ncbi:MAG: methionyl-tRNA formyltransferase [Betaproteobacteria bacterium]|jgi:methionyl-tRNA formyltransferase|nr:methionyl-tRNA formyltransferase [Betaproteobacteria bacterium]MBK7080635.1 methionyl-tRNA formyltransferase [Betaproteobacteria bacterium]MBK9674780.1 methionyl-tRNA formyltransferase [Betaproteobacteria bacterium]